MEFRVNKFKKIEKTIFIIIFHILIAIKTFFILIGKCLYNIISSNFTIVIVPGSTNKPKSIKINYFLLFIILFFLISSFGLFLYLSSADYNRHKDYIKENIITKQTEQENKEYKDAIVEILDSHKVFKNNLDSLIAKVNSSTLKSLQNEEFNGEGGPLNPVNEDSITNLDLQKMEYKKLLRDYQFASIAFGELSKKAEDYNKVLKDLPFGIPINGMYTITSGFGLRVHPITKTWDHHTGVDLVYHLGTPVLATADGIVEKVEFNATGYGWYIKIYHKLGFSTLYAHLRSRPLVNPGDKIKKGQLIGYMGSTGISTGTHLHYEIRLGNSLKDPWDYMKNH